MAKPIPDTLGLCLICYKHVWAGSSYSFIKEGRAVHPECFLRQSSAFKQENPQELSPFINEWRRGRIAWHCPKCKKRIWLTSHMYETTYSKNEVCFECQSVSLENQPFTVYHKCSEESVKSCRSY